MWKVFVLVGFLFVVEAQGILFWCNHKAINYYYRLHLLSVNETIFFSFRKMFDVYIVND